MDEETFIRVHLDVTQVKKTMCNANFFLVIKRGFVMVFKYDVLHTYFMLLCIFSV